MSRKQVSEKNDLIPHLTLGSIMGNHTLRQQVL